MHRPRPRPAAALASIAALTALAACAINPATGERELSLIGEGREIQMGREADPAITASMGLVDDPELQSYVSDLGARLAATSERPGLPWTFKVVDDPLVNAFALPGGFIYVTRGILAHFESEAELAGVLGHEIGHVTARHSVTQISRQQLQQIGLGVGMILSEDVRRYGGLLSAGLGLLNLRYSRGDESESDELGVRYMTRVGYDPEALEGVFRMLASVSGGGDGRVPEWQLTHPYPENREAAIDEVIARTPGAAAADRVARDAYLDRIDGMVFGQNPREGFFRGPLFLHPELAFQLRFPDGWETVNQRTVVAALSPEEDAIVALGLAEGETDPAAALRAFLAQEGVTGGPLRAGESGGITTARAPFSARTQDGEVRGEVMFALHDGTLYRVLGYGGSSRWSARAGAVAATLDSFAGVSDPAVLQVRPWRLEIVRLPREMTLAEFHERYPSPAAIEVVARINRRDPADRIPAGTRLKRVVGQPLP